MPAGDPRQENDEASEDEEEAQQREESVQPQQAPLLASENEGESNGQVRYLQDTSHSIRMKLARMTTFSFSVLKEN